MVETRLVSAGLTLLLTMLASGAAQAAPLFNLSIARARVQYGQALTLALHARTPHPALDTIDLSPLAHEFVVRTPYGLQRDPARDRQSWKIEVYPRHPGNLRIPPLRFAGTDSLSQRIHVTPARGQQDRTPIEVDTRISATDVWVGQQVRLNLRVTSDNPFALLETNATSVDGVDAIPTPMTRHRSGKGRRPRVTYGIGWRLAPQSAGTFKLQLPAVRYSIDGIVARRFFPPRITLHVHALPAFIPPTMPIGRIRVHTSLPQRRFFIDRRRYPLYVNILDRAGGSTVGRILRQLRDSPALNIYPPEKHALRTHNGTAGDGWVGYRIPFSPRTTGLIALPSIHVQYFDPATGRIVTRTVTPGSILAVDPRGLVSAAVALFAGILALCTLGGRRLARFWRLYRGYAAALRAAEVADSAIALRVALAEIARAEGWPSNLSAAQWLQRWQMHHPASAVSARQGVLRLQETLYGRAGASLEDIRRPLVDAFRCRLGPLRYLTCFSTGGHRARS